MSSKVFVCFTHLLKGAAALSAFLSLMWFFDVAKPLMQEETYVIAVNFAWLIWGMKVVKYSDESDVRRKSKPMRLIEVKRRRKAITKETKIGRVHV